VPYCVAERGGTAQVFEGEKKMGGEPGERAENQQRPGKPADKMIGISSFQGGGFRALNDEKEASVTK